MDATLLLVPEGPALGFIVCWCGDIEEGERVLQPLRLMGAPLLDSVAPVPYAVVQNLLTEVFRPCLHRYWKAGFMSRFFRFNQNIKVARRRPSRGEGAPGSA